MGTIVPSSDLADGKTAQAADVLLIITEFNGSIDEANIDATSKVLLANQVNTISAIHTYTAKPDFSGAPLVATDVDETKIATRGGTSAFTAKQTFTAGLDATGTIFTAIMEKMATGSIPAAGAAHKGRIIYDTTVNKMYGCNGSAWIQLDQTPGAYAGGGVKPYSSDLTISENGSKKMLVKLDALSTAATLYIQGEIFPKDYYLELGQHSHGLTGGGAASVVTDAGHTHNVVVGSHTHSGSFPSETHTHQNSHDHNAGTLGGTTSSHDHGGNTGYVANYYFSPPQHRHTIASEAGLSVTISGATATDNSNTGTPSATVSIANYDYGTIVSASGTTGISVATTLSGNTANTGVNAGTISSALKDYIDSMQVKVNGVDITATILTATGWAKIGDGTATHAFVTTGSGTVDIFSSLAVGMNTIEFIEPTAAKGGRVLCHVEIT